MGDRHARPVEPHVDDDRGDAAPRPLRLSRHSASGPSTLEPHLQRRHTMPRGDKRPHARLEQRTDEPRKLLLRRAAQRKGEIEGVAGLGKLSSARHLERLRPLPHVFRQPADKLRAEARREAPTRQPHHPADRIDADLAELLEHRPLQPQRRGWQRIDKLVGRGGSGWRRPLRHERAWLTRDSGVWRSLCLEEMASGLHNHAPPSPAACRRGCAQAHQPIGVMGSGPGGPRRIGDRPPGLEPARGERPHRRAHKPRFATEKPRRRRDVEVEAFRAQALSSRCFSTASLHRHRGREAPTPAGDLEQRGTVGHGVVMIDPGACAGLRTMRTCQHRHRFGKRHAGVDRAPGRGSPLTAVSAGQRGQGPRPADHRHHASRLPLADEHRHVPQGHVPDQAPLHRPAWKPERQDARHGTLPAPFASVSAPGDQRRPIGTAPLRTEAMRGVLGAPPPIASRPVARSSEISTVGTSGGCSHDHGPSWSDSRSRRTASEPTRGAQACDQGASSHARQRPSDATASTLSRASAHDGSRRAATGLTKNPIVPLPRAANCQRRRAVLETRFGQASTAVTPGQRSA